MPAKKPCGHTTKIKTPGAKRSKTVTCTQPKGHPLGYQPHSDGEHGWSEHMIRDR